MTTTTRTRTNRPFPVLAVLFAGAFVMGCAEMLVVGLVDLIAVDLDVSVAAVGALVAANALGLALGGPILTLLTTRFDRRPVLITATIVFIAATLLPVLGADYPVLIVARVVAGAVQGLFIAAAMVMATSIVAPERAGRAMAVVITGFASSSALGLPLGTLLGQAIGWRGAFAAVVAVSVLVLVACAFVLPSVPTAPAARGGGAVGQARYAFAPRVLAVLGVAVLVFMAMQSVITYLVPYLDEIVGVSGAGVSIYLLAYGVATTAGSIVGGRFADANARLALVVGAAGVMASLVVLLLFGASPVVALVAVLGIGLFGMSTGPSLQHRVVSLAGPGAPLAASLPASAVNAGIAAGAFAGGAALDAGGAAASVLTGVVVGAVAIVAAIATGALRPAAIDAAPEPVATR